ncbi:MAG: AAA family ATPase [Ilumatobacteraceae bacterium]
MDQTDVMHALRVAIEADVPVLLWGEPGVGKTASVNALASALGWPIETVLASLREPSDFAGLPVVIDGDMRFAPPDWATRLAGAERALCFFDEVSTAAPSVQKALLRVVHERVVGDLAMGAGVRMVAAANPVDVAAGGWDLTAPLANRFCHLDWPIDPGTIAIGLTGHWPDPVQVSIDDDWERHLGRIAATVSGFIMARPHLAHSRPDEESDAGRAWPSPRSWAAVIRVLAVAEGTVISDEARMALIAGLVGDGAAVECATYERDLDLPDPEALLSDPGAYVRPRRDDQVHAVVAAVVAAAVRSPTAARWEAALRVFIAVAEAGNVDIGAGGVRQLAPLRPDGAAAPEGLAVFGPILQAIGLL